MFPGLGGSPRQMMELMKQLGLKSEEVKASRVVIEKTDGGKIVVSQPQVIQMEMQGNKSFQVSGRVGEEAAAQAEPDAAKQSGEPSESDAELVMRQAGVSRAAAENALRESGGDIAQAILSLQRE